MTFDKKYLTYTLLIIALSLFAYHFLFPTATIPSNIPDPIQADILDKSISYKSENGLIEIKLLASYSIDACVKSKKKYFTDGASSVSPLDLTLAWGTLNQKDIDHSICYSQRNRWYYYSLDHDSPVTIEYVGQHSANTHIIPANELVKNEINKIKKNDFVNLKGYLVNVYFSDGQWSSSLSREDTGDGACEILYVEEVLIY